MVDGVKLIVADFDGTFTRSEAAGGEWEEFLPAFAAALGDETGKDPGKLEAAIRATLGMVDNPETDVWMFGGYAVASALSDMYLKITRAARVALIAMWIEEEEGVDEGYLDAVLGKSFVAAYPQVQPVFRHGADELVQLMAADKRVVVVTNSGTDAVRQKLGMLQGGDELQDRVMGNAKKYVITPDQEGEEEFLSKLLSPELQIPGLERPVLLHRGHYIDIIAQAMANQGGMGFSEVLVFGDNFELDLAVPLELGARVILVANSLTQQYEIDFVQNHPRGQVVHGLPDLLEMLR